MGNALFKLQIMASDHMVYDGDAVSVSLPTIEGRVGILAHHSNVIMAVVPGTVEYDAVPGQSGTASAADGTYTGEGEASSEGLAATQQKGRQQVIVSDGLIKVENGEVMILVDTAERPEDIDEARAVRAEEKAREDMKRANTNRDHAMVEAELSRALSRIKGSKAKHKF